MPASPGAAGGSAQPPAAPDASSSPGSVAAAPDGKPTDLPVATAAPASAPASPPMSESGLQIHAATPQASNLTPTGQAAAGPPPSPLPPATLAEARDTVALRVVHAAQDGVETVSIDLHPADLGHVGIELSFHGGAVSVQMTLANHATYEAFARDRVVLEQQLAQSGLNLGSGGLDLRFSQKQGERPSTSRFSPSMPDAVSASPAAPQRADGGLLNIIA